MLPMFPMLVAFATGFLAGILWRQMRLLSLLIFVVFVLLVAGLLTISIQFPSAN